MLKVPETTESKTQPRRPPTISRGLVISTLAGIMALWAVAVIGTVKLTQVGADNVTETIEKSIRRKAEMPSIESNILTILGVKSVYYCVRMSDSMS